MGRIYSAEFSDVAVTLAQDLFSLLVADDEPIRLMGCTISQRSDVGDAAEEGLLIQIIRGWGTVGSLGSAPTPVVLDGKQGATSVTVRANDTTEASAGTPVTVHSEVWNIRMPWVYLPIPELRPRVDQADDIVSVSLITAPNDELTVSGTIYWEEL